jgi:multidrug efflux pump subunit AcrA (membrane-fusion protein)
MTSNISRYRSRKLLAVRVGAVAGLLAVAGFTGLIIAQSQSQNTAAAATTESTATVAETSTVSTGTLTTTLDTVGNLEPTRQTTLTFSVSAPVTAIFAEAGSRVQAGQVLATLDTAEGARASFRWPSSG